MSIEKNISRIYQILKDINYIIFLMAYIAICSISVMIFEVVNTLLIHSDIMVRFELGLPIILQLILTYVVYRKNNENRIMKILFIVVFLYALLCATLSLYELYFTYPSFVDDLIFHVVFAQIVFQFVLVVILLICLIAKVVNKLVIMKVLIMAAFTVIILLLMQLGNKAIDNELVSWMILMSLFVNIFNPVLLYILSYTAKGKLFIKAN